MPKCPFCQHENHADREICAECSKLLPKEETLTGRTIGQVEVLEPIGRGGVGIVYRARHRLLGSDCALKVLHKKYAANLHIIERFRREAMAVTTLNHENAVSIMDFGWEKGVGAYQLMELLEGITLGDALKEGQQFSYERLIRIVRQIASALSATHKQGILHRDIKPDNIFLCQADNQPERVKLLDFGIAKILQEENAEKLTQTGVVLGTPQFMSPEQAVGHWANVDQRTDIYAFGGIIYKLLTGHGPIAPGHWTDVLARQARGEITPLTLHRPDLEGYFITQVLEWCLAFECDHRPDTIDVLMPELEAALDFLPNKKNLALPEPGFSPGEKIFATVLTRSVSLDDTAVDGTRFDISALSPTIAPDELFLNPLFSNQLNILQHISPLKFNQEQLRGLIALDIVGDVIAQQAFFPQVCVRGLRPIEGIVQQLCVSEQPDDWKHILIETTENIIDVFPHPPGGLGAILFGGEGAHHSMAIEETLLQGGEKPTLDVVERLSMLNGVDLVLLMDTNCEIVRRELNEDMVQDVNQFHRRLLPVMEILDSLPFGIRGLDCWFVQNRVLLWQLSGHGILVVVASHALNGLMLSVLLERHGHGLFELCEEHALDDSTNEVVYDKPTMMLSALSEEELEGELELFLPEESPFLDADTLKQIKYEYANYIGPMAGILFKKFMKELGFSPDTFPREEGPAFIQRLAQKLDGAKHTIFLELCTELLSKNHRK